MTLVLAWNLKEYALLAADGRVKLFTHDGETLNQDGVPKVFDTPIGIVAGSGLLQMRDALFRVCQSTAKRDLRQLPGRLRAAHAAAYDSTPQDQWWSEHLQRTGVFVGYGYRGQVAVNLFHSDMNYTPQHVPVGVPGTMLPDETTQFAPYEKRLMRDGRSPKRFKTIDASIDYHMRLTVAFMKRAQLLSPELLDSTMQIAIVGADDSRELLDVTALDAYDVAPLELQGDESED